jgi:general stress protein 26
MPERLNTPKSDRPHMPGYGISEGRKGMLPWSWARGRLEKNRNFWISTVRAGGDGQGSRPHTMPVWGVWHNERLYFSTAITSTKARNLLANPSCTATTEDALEAVIVEGRAEIVRNKAALRPVWKAYKAKYEWSIDGEPLFAITPTTAFAFIEAADRFGTAATRWRFG